MELNDVDRKVIDFMVEHPGECGCGYENTNCRKIDGVDVNGWVDSIKKLIFMEVLEDANRIYDVHIRRDPGALLRLAALGWLPQELGSKS